MNEWVLLSTCCVATCFLIHSRKPTFSNMDLMGEVSRHIMTVLGADSPETEIWISSASILQ